MKGKRKIILALALMLVFSTVVFAARRVNITVTYDNIKVFVDGNQVQFGKDTKGKQIEPFIYNGTTYLPLRAVGEALGKEVQWDPSTKSAFLGSGVVDNNTAQVNTGEKYLTDVLKPFGGKGINNYEEGKNKGLEFFMSGWQKVHINYNLEGKYTRITGIPADVDSTSDTIVLRFIGDGNLLKEYVIERGEMGDSVDVDVTGVRNLLIQAEREQGTYAKIRIIDLKIR